MLFASYSSLAPVYGERTTITLTGTPEEAITSYVRDFFVVLKDEFDKSTLPEIFDKDNINCEFWSETEFYQTLVQKKHNIQAIAAIFSPTEYVWVNRIQDEEGPDWVSSRFKVNEYALKKAALQKAASSMNRARHYCNFQTKLLNNEIPTEDDIKQAGGECQSETPDEILYRSKKMLCHAIRTLQFALQLFSEHKIYDFKCVQPYHAAIMEETNTNWSFYAAKYRPIYEDLMKSMPERCQEEPDPEKEKIPVAYHRLYKKIQIPSIQRTYLLAIDLELRSLFLEFYKVCQAPRLVC